MPPMEYILNQMNIPLLILKSKLFLAQLVLNYYDYYGGLC
jgi:hypothetical protein